MHGFANRSPRKRKTVNSSIVRTPKRNQFVSEIDKRRSALKSIIGQKRRPAGRTGTKRKVAPKRKAAAGRTGTKRKVQPKRPARQPSLAVKKALMNAALGISKPRARRTRTGGVVTCVRTRVPRKTHKKTVRATRTIRKTHIPTHMELIRALGVD